MLVVLPWLPVVYSILCVLLDPNTRVLQSIIPVDTSLPSWGPGTPDWSPLQTKVSRTLDKKGGVGTRYKYINYLDYLLFVFNEICTELRLNIQKPL